MSFGCSEGLTVLLSMDTNTVLPNPTPLNFNYEKKISPISLSENAEDLLNSKSTSDASINTETSKTNISQSIASMSAILSNISESSLISESPFISLSTPYSVQSRESDATSTSRTSSRMLLYDIVEINAVNINIFLIFKNIFFLIFRWTILLMKPAYRQHILL